MTIVPKVETLSLDTAEAQAVDDGRGRQARSPSEIPARGLRDVLWRVYNEVLADRVTLIAAGVTYYIVLAIFPGRGVLVSITVC